MIGNIGDYSGVVGATTSVAQDTARVWAAWVNANGGLNGHPVELVTVDAGGDPNRALTLARDLVENRGVIAFMGNVQPLSVTGPAEYLAERGIPVVGGDSASPVWFSNPMYFANLHPPDVASLGAARISAQQGKTDLALLYCSEAAACAVINDAFDDAAQSRVGVRVVYRTSASLAQPDFTAECLRARDAGAESFLLATDGESIRRVARACAQLGYHPLLLTAGTSITPGMEDDANLEGLTAAPGAFPWIATDTDAARTFSAAMAQYAPDVTPAFWASGVWASGMLLREAAKGLPADPSAADVLAGLWTITDNTLGGLSLPLTYAEGQPSPEIQCYFHVVIRDGSWVAPNQSAAECLP